jgi:hypothetical protein
VVLGQQRLGQLDITQRTSPIQLIGVAVIALSVGSQADNTFVII